MAQTNVTSEDGEKWSLALPSADGTSSILVDLRYNSDPAKPPRLINVERKSLTAGSRSTTSTGLSDAETHVILSIASGYRLATQFFNDTVKPILDQIYSKESQGGSESPLHIHETKSNTHILELVDELFFPKAQEGKPLRIILASGDGGIVDLVNGLLSKPSGPSYVAPKVILLPLGTANALYHSVNPRKNQWGLDALSSSTSRPLPVFTASFSSGARLLTDEARKEQELPKSPDTGYGILHGAVVCSWGMHASLVGDSDTTEYRKFGVERFKMAAKEALYPADGSAPHPYKATVSILQNSQWTKLPEKDHLYVLVTLVSNLEQPFCISPKSKPLDGSMHLVHFGPASGDEAMRIMGLAYQGGKHIEDSAVRYEAIDGLRIDLNGEEDDARWRRICIDGKIVRVESDGWIEVRKDSQRVLEVVVPAGQAL